MRNITYICVGCLALLTCGCGMPEYEKRMDEQRARVSAFDDINRMLDAPIEPTVMKKADGKDEPHWPFDFFLRLPKGFGAIPKDKTPYLEPFPCYRYSNDEPGVSIFVAANLVPEAKTKEEISKYYAGNFRTFIKLAIAEHYMKTTKMKLNIPERIRPQEQAVPVFSAYPDPVMVIKYDVVSYSDQGNKLVAAPTQYDVYVHETERKLDDKNSGEKKPEKQVCIIVQHPVRMPNADTFQKSIQASLRTLDIGPNTAAKRGQFKRGR
jgi:hypothetical protein